MFFRWGIVLKGHHILWGRERVHCFHPMTAFLNRTAINTVKTLYPFSLCIRWTSP